MSVAQRAVGAGVSRVLQGDLSQVAVGVCHTSLGWLPQSGRTMAGSESAAVWRFQGDQCGVYPKRELS
jgi:hypothetical protein